MAMRLAGHGDEAKPSSVIPERPTAPSDGGMSELIARLDALHKKRTRGPWRIGGLLGENPRVIDMGEPLTAPFAVFHSDDSSGRTNAEFVLALENLVTELGWPTIRSALAASAPSCLVGEKELETGQHLVADRLGAISDTEKGA